MVCCDGVFSCRLHFVSVTPARLLVVCLYVSHCLKVGMTYLSRSVLGIGIGWCVPSESLLVSFLFLLLQTSP